MLYRAVVRNQIFIIDDDETAGLVLADYAELALPGWKATVIDNGYDAILQIGLPPPRIILLHKPVKHQELTDLLQAAVRTTVRWRMPQAGACSDLL
jgi:hypothetical protein